MAIRSSRQILVSKGNRAPRNSRTHKARVAVSGVVAQTIIEDRAAAPIIEKQHAMGFTYYEVKSEKFAGRYYFVRQLPNDAWHCSSDDQRVAEKLIAQVKAFIAASHESVAAA